jgi:hypothetical protein
MKKYIWGFNFDIENYLPRANLLGLKQKPFHFMANTIHYTKDILIKIMLQLLLCTHHNPL